MDIPIIRMRVKSQGQDVTAVAWNVQGTVIIYDSRVEYIWSDNVSEMLHEMYKLVCCRYSSLFIYWEEDLEKNLPVLYGYYIPVYTIIYNLWVANPSRSRRQWYDWQTAMILWDGMRFEGGFEGGFLEPVGNLSLSIISICQWYDWEATYQQNTRAEQVRRHRGRNDWVFELCRTVKGKREGTVGAGTKDDRVWGVRRQIVGKGGGGKSGSLHAWHSCKFAGISRGLIVY